MLSARARPSKMIRGGGRVRKREYDQDSSYRDRDDFQSKRARGSYSSRGSYSNTSPRRSRGSSYSTSPRVSSTRGSTFRPDSRGSSRSETRGSFRSESRGSFRSDTRGSYKSSYDSSSSRGAYKSDSRGSYRGSASSRGPYDSGSRGSYRGPGSSRGSYNSESRGSYRGSASSRGGSYKSESRGSYRGSASSREGSYNSESRGSYRGRGSTSLRGSYNSDSRGSYRGSDSRGSYRGSSSSRGDRRRSFGDDRGSHTSRPSSTGSRGRGSFRNFDRSPSREIFRSPSSDYRGSRKFSGDREDFRGSRSPSFRSSRDTSSSSRYMEEKYRSKDGFSGSSGGFRGSYKQRFPRERSSRPPYSRGRGSSQFRGRGRSSFEHRPRQFRKSVSPGKSYHDSESDELGAKYFRRHRRHSDFLENSHFSDDEKDQEDDKDRYPDFETLTEVKPEEENEAKKHDLAGIILRLLMDEGGHMKVHDLEMELITSKNIQFSTSDDFDNFLSDNKDVFKVHTIEVGDMSEVGEKSVTGHSKIMICRQHSKYAGSCDDEKCEGLHLCKYRVLSDCTRRACVYGHDVRRNPHNKKVLRDHMLHRLSFPQLQQMFRNLYNRQGINIPLICSFYNSETRCRGEYRNNMNYKPCPFLHICKKFIDGTCDQMKNCSRSHSFYDKATFRILERYGLNPDDYSGGKREILRFLKNKCQTSTTNESETHSEHEDISDVDDDDDDEYKSWDDDEEEEENLEEHGDEEGGHDEEVHPEKEGEGENAEYDEEHPEGYEEEDAEHGAEYPEGDEEHGMLDEKEEQTEKEEEKDGQTEIENEGTAQMDEGVEKNETGAQDEGIADKTIADEDGNTADTKTKTEQSQSLEGKEDAEIKMEDDENKQEKDVNGDNKMETENIEKPVQEEQNNQNVQKKGQKKTPTKLQMVRGNKRRVKQTRTAKQRSGSESTGEKQPLGEDSTEEKLPTGDDGAGEKQSSGDDSAIETIKTLAVWQVSPASQEEWKELNDVVIQDLERKYQQYLDNKTQNILIEDIEYKVDFSILEGTTEAENEEGVKLKREIPQE